MILYQLRMAWKSLKRTPVLSTLLVLGIALGIAIATAFVTAYYVLSGDPIPEKSDRLFYVQLDAWDPEQPRFDDEPEEPPDQVTWRDAAALLESEIPSRQSAMFKAELTVHPDGEGARPFRAETRLCSSDFFVMFDAPFQSGGPWSAVADEGPEPVVVLDHETNLRLFGGEDSVGRSVRLEDGTFTVVGVLAPWHPKPKFWDVTQSEFEPPASVFMPLSWTPVMEISTTGNTSNWKFYSGDEFEDFLASETVWLQMWVQLDEKGQRAAYEDFLEGYIREQKSLGRFQRPLNYRLRDVKEWLAHEDVVPPEASTMVVISLLFLVVSSVNLIGILLGKFLSRAHEVGVRRALGASRGSVFLQHIVECELVGVLGGTAGLVLALGVLEIVNRMLIGGEYRLFGLDPVMIGAGLVLSLGAGLIAGLYPAWRICRVQPATYLKQG